MDSRNMKPDPRFTFRSYVVDPANAFAFHAARFVARNPGKGCTPFLLYGDEGAGKTHLLQAIGHEYLRTGGRAALFMTAESFLADYIEALKRRTISAFRHRFKRLNLLLIDDIHFLRTRESTSEELSFLIGMVQDNGGQVVAASDCPVARMTDMCVKLTAKFEHGLSVEVGSPSPACRLAILRALRRKQKGTLDDRLIRFMAEQIPSNTRGLIGAYIRASAYEKLLMKRLTLPALQRLLQDLLPTPDIKPCNCVAGTPSSPCELTDIP